MATVLHWFLLNGLQLNASKSEAMVLGTAAQLQFVGAAFRAPDVTGASLPLTDELKTLGLIVDRRQPLYFRFDKHAAAATKACNYHLHIRNALSDDVAKRIGCSIVDTDKLDYCNSLL
jgi:hypothetical protein